MNFNVIIKLLHSFTFYIICDTTNPFYLFFTQPFQNMACHSTRIYTPQLAQIRKLQLRKSFKKLERFE